MKNKQIPVASNRTFASPLLLSTGSLIRAFFCALLVTMFSIAEVRAQNLSPFDRAGAQAMLSAAQEDLKKSYYDPGFRGIDLDARFKDAEQQVKQAVNRDQLILIVAQTMLELNDSHTFFVPPSRAARFEYGWEMQMVGDKAFVTAVKPKSDAEAKGLKVGDLIISVDGYPPSRDNLWKMYYRYYALMPTLSIKFVVQSPGDPAAREVAVLAKIQKGANVVNWRDIFIRFLREHGDVEKDRYAEFGNDLLVWRMNSFDDPDHMNAIMNKAQKFKSLIIDLRGNLGGYTDALSRLLGALFDHEVKIADQKGRKEMKPLSSKSHGATFKGQLVVLIDSDSASASELFARTIQLEKRGTVIGDRSSGAVMEAKYFEHETGVGQVLYFGTLVTIADLIMVDGKSLERVGVTPDEVLLPAGSDLATKLDPVLARAADILGVKLDPEKAGTLFPKVWLP
jgi:C-terminal processing protease CtpA/Prc